MFGWFKRLKGRDVDVIAETVPLSTLVRWYMYDIAVKDPSDLNKAFDLMPVSSEGDEKEKEDAYDRLVEIKALLPFLQVYSEINAKAVTVLQRNELLAMGLTEDQLEQEAELLESFYQTISLSVLVSAIATATKLGLITVTGTLTGLGDKDE